MPAKLPDLGVFVPETKQKHEVPCFRLRFVKRIVYEKGDAGHPRTIRILQQQVEIRETYNGSPVRYSTEWRDVPEVDEGADASPK